MRDKATRQCPQTATFEEKGEPKRIRTEVPLLTSLTPYRWAKPVHTWYWRAWYAYGVTWYLIDTTRPGRKILGCVSDCDPTIFGQQLGWVAVTTAPAV